MRKHVIHLEGIDGAGKSALIAELSAIYGYSTFREPGGTPLGEYLREHVLYSKAYSPVSKRMMFALSRTALQDHFLTDREGGVALVDRSLVSSLVYDMEVGMEEQIEAYHTLGVCFPEHIVYVKVAPEVALARLEARPQGIQDEQSFLENYIDQGLMSSTSTVLDMLKTWSARYEDALELICNHRLVQHKPLSVINNDELGSAVDKAFELIQQMITGSRP